MKLFNIIKIVTCLSVLALFGCGGGGSSSSGSSVPQSQTTRITGTVSASPVTSAAVKVYKIVSGAKVEPAIATGTTGTGGTYSISLESYTGPIIVEVTGGTYTDEATGNTNATIPATAPLRAVVPNASETVSVAVTPLTELACQLAGSNLAKSNITAVNEQIAKMFKLSDIIQSQPVAPIATELNKLNLANPSQKDQYDYTLVLAVLSQMSKDLNKTVAETVSYIKPTTSGSSSLEEQQQIKFQSAVINYFLSSNTNNKTGISNPENTLLPTIGGKTVIVKLSTIGTLPSGYKIVGISLKIKLPAGVSVKTAANQVLASYLVTSGVALKSSVLGSLNGNDITINLTDPIIGDSGGVLIGEFATLYCDVAYNTELPLGDFTITPDKVTGYFNGNTDQVPVEVKSNITVQ